jgi:hypothetical protein
MSSRLHPTPRRVSRRAISATTAVLVVFLALAMAMASSAMAGKPKGEFAVFADCPLSTAGVNECVYSQTTGGSLVFGTMTAPITNAITLQGGLIVKEKEETFVNPTEGVTLSKTPETVTGGFESKPLTLTLELVGSVALSRTKLAKAEGVALKLPVRAHLKNELLGEACFIGSSSSPITLNLTTGTTSPPAPNKPIKGSPGTFESKEEGTLEIFKGDSLVDNAFSVPGAKGCGGAFESIIDPVLDAKFSLPSAAGHSTAIMNGTSRFATAEAVRKSEE